MENLAGSPAGVNLNQMAFPQIHWNQSVSIFLIINIAEIIGSSFDFMNSEYWVYIKYIKTGKKDNLYSLDSLYFLS